MTRLMMALAHMVLKAGSWKCSAKIKIIKTYNSGYSLVVTDPTTNPPISSLSTAERTGCPFLLNLWSYVLATPYFYIIFYAELPKHYDRVSSASLGLRMAALRCKNFVDFLIG
jgi:hypothetical protein